MGRTFDDRSNERISRSVLWTEAQRPQTRRVQNLARQFSGARQCNIIRFQIVGALVGINHAQAMVLAVPAGFTINDVAGLSGYGTQLVDIYDAVGCFFNEPSAAFTGRVGFAAYMQPTSLDIGNATDPYLTPQWEVFSLCCPAGC